MARREVVKTPCKINLHLGVHRERDARGYHRVDSVMVPVALFDTVVVEEAPELQVNFDPALGIPAQKTGVWRAATLLAEALGVEPRVRVSVAAQIPERAGLGGSSADAGATLRALSALWGVDALDGRVVAAARRVGADVPFFLRPEPGLYLGAGDVRERTFPGAGMPLALVMPRAEGGSTVEAYAEFDRMGKEPKPYGAMCEALASGDIPGVAASLHNNLAPAACALCPEVGRALEWLSERPGVIAAQVTGSGTCSFAICESAEAARRVTWDAVCEHDFLAWATETLT